MNQKQVVGITIHFIIITLVWWMILFIEMEKNTLFWAGMLLFAAVSLFVFNMVKLSLKLSDETIVLKETPVIHILEEDDA